MMRLFLAVLIVLVAGGNTWAGEANAQIHVIFLGWYDKEHVELYSADKRIYSSSITTESTSGVAASTEVKVEKSPLNFGVSIPRLKLMKTTELEPAKGSFFYVTLEHNQLSFEQTKEPLALD